MSIRQHCADLAAGTFEDITSLIGGTYLYGQTNTALGKIESHSVAGTAVAGSKTYPRLTPSSTSGSGTGATFTISRASGSYTASIEKQGYGYAIGDTLTFLGSALDGSNGTNDCTVTVVFKYGFLSFPMIPEEAISNTEGSTAYSFKLEYSYDPCGRRRAYYFGASHSNPPSPGNSGHPRYSHFMLDLDSDTLYDIPVPQWALTFAESGNAHQWGLCALAPGRRRVYRGLANSAHNYWADINEDDPRDIDTSHWTQNSNLSNTIESGVQRGCLVHFPDRRSRLFFNFYGDSFIAEQKDNETAWTVRWSYPDDFSVNSVSDGFIALYNPIAHCVIFGGGGTNLSQLNNKFWRLDPDGTVTACADWPGATYFYTQSGSSSKGVIEPVTGDFLVFASDNQDPASATRYDCWKYVFGTDAWTRLTALESAIPSSGFATTAHTMVGLLPVAIPDFGVIMFFSVSKVWIYKHTANTIATDGISYTAQLALPGCTHPSVNLKLENETDFLFKRTWDQGEPLIDAYATSQGYTHYAGHIQNVLMYAQPLGDITNPHVVTDVKPAGSTGSLRFDVPAYSGQSQGALDVAIDGSTDGETAFISPLSDLGPVLYVRYWHRVNAAMIDTHFTEQNGDVGGSGGFAFNCTTPSAGSKVITNAAGFPSTVDGFYIAVIATSGMTNWVPGIYGPIISHTSTTITLDSASNSPTPSGAGSGGVLSVGSTSRAGGWKEHIVYGNLPFGSTSNQGLECTMNNGAEGSGALQFGGYPQMYGASGTDAPAAKQTTVPYVADTWKEVIVRIEMREEYGNDTPGNGLTEWWYGGQRCGSPWNTQRLIWDGADGDGFGRIYITSFQTRKDPTQNHSTGYMYFGQLWMGTEPPMSTSSAAQGNTRLAIFRK